MTVCSQRFFASFRYYSGLAVTAHFQWCKTDGFNVTFPYTMCSGNTIRSGELMTYHHHYHRKHISAVICTNHKLGVGRILKLN